MQSMLKKGFGPAGYSSGRPKRGVDFNSTSSLRPGEPDDGDDRTESPMPDEQGLPPSPGIIPKAPSKPATGQPGGGRRPVPLFGGAGAATSVIPEGSKAEPVEHSYDSAETCLENTQVDRDELQWKELVGTGITAEVFKGRWRDREVAIKRLNFTNRRTAQVRQEVAFLRETGVIAKINHDNLVKFYGLSFDTQPYLLITEFCNGGTCYDLLHETEGLELVIEQQLKLCCDVACAMEYLHKFRPQIIHRDLKSLNLLLSKIVSTTTDVPHVKVSDFGLAKMKDKDNQWGKMTVEAGTFHWMAPEVATGHYDEKADVYSFAMVLFEFICQEIPFEDLEPVDVLKCTSNGARPDMEAVPPATPKALVDMMEQSWSHDSRARPSFESICKTLNTIVREMFG